MSTRSHCDLVLQINKLIQKFDEETSRDPGHGVRIPILKTWNILFQTFDCVFYIRKKKIPVYNISKQKLNRKESSI